MRIRGALPGLFKCVVTPSRRNAFNIHLHSNAPLVQHLRKLGRTLEPKFGCEVNTPCLQLLAGVSLNGRKYKQGDRCEYLPKVARRGNAEGVGGRLGASESHLIGSIKMFYHFNIDGQITTFVDILDHPILEKERSMYIVDTVLSLRPGKDEYRVTTDSTIYHIDAITSKVLFAPHYSPHLKATRMCAICMWEAR